jgi:hypothetical protein
MLAKESLLPRSVELSFLPQSEPLNLNYSLETGPEHYVRSSTKGPRNVRLGRDSSQSNSQKGYLAGFYRGGEFELSALARPFTCTRNVNMTNLTPGSMLKLVGKYWLEVAVYQDYVHFYNF